MQSHNSLMRAELVTAKFWDLIKIRLPWLIIGLFGGLFATLVVSRFEVTLKETIALAFFIPVIAYMSDAIGTQTETILIRALADLKFNITKYVHREFWVGATIGFFLGVVTGVFAYFLSASFRVGVVVGLSLFISMSTAAILACITPLVFRFFGKDPAVGSGPFTTALQDIISLAIYFVIAVIIL